MAASANIVDIRGARLFPFPFLVLGAGFVLAGLGVVLGYPIVGVILVVVGILIVTSYEGTEIDPDKHIYREYNSFFLLKSGKAKRFDGIEKIYINAGKVSQRIYTAHTSSSSTFQNVEYNAYLKFRSGEKIFLFSSRNKSRMLQRTKQIAASLNTAVHDNSVAR